MSKFLVQAARRSGFAGVWRAGRMWPSDSPVEVEVLEQDACPKVPVPDSKPPREQPDPKRIGRVAFAAVMADARLSKTPVDAKDVANSLAKAAELEQKLSASEARVSQLEAEKAELAQQCEALSTRAQTAEKDLETLSRRVATLQAELDEARKAAVSPDVAPPLPGVETEAPTEPEADLPVAKPSGAKRGGRR